LIVQTIQEAKKSKYLSRIIVSTDSKKFAEISKKAGAEVPFLRPAKLAGDKSSVVDAVVHLLKKLEKTESYRPDYIILLQPNMPMRTVKDIDKSLKLLFSRKADAAVSICHSEPLIFTKDKKDFIKLIASKQFINQPNRQQLPATYRLDGSMIYAIKTDVFLKNKSFLKGKLAGYVIPRWRAVDLDEVEDFVIGEMIFKNSKKIERKIKNFK
jgi:N-acylneuraminate cytidylyltransferase/CMP-N,N'-diacetyllegionaminic acid synthase